MPLGLSAPSRFIDHRGRGEHDRGAGAGPARRGANAAASSSADRAADSSRAQISPVPSGRDPQRQADQRVVDGAVAGGGARHQDLAAVVADRQAGRRLVGGLVDPRAVGVDGHQAAGAGERVGLVAARVQGAVVRQPLAGPHRPRPHEVLLLVVGAVRGQRERPRRAEQEETDERDQEGTAHRVSVRASTAVGRPGACRRSGRWGSTAATCPRTRPPGPCRRRPGRAGRCGRARRARSVSRDFSVAAFCPTDRSTALVSTARVAACSVAIASSVMRLVSANGDILAACRISSEYALPTPAITVWSVRTPLIWPLRLRIAVANSSVVTARTSGPSRAMPGTSRGSVTK